MSIEKVIKKLMAETAAKKAGAVISEDTVSPQGTPGQSISDEPNNARNLTNTSAKQTADMQPTKVGNPATDVTGQAQPGDQKKDKNKIFVPGQPTVEATDVEGDDVEEEEYSIDVTEDVEALINGEDLTEEFKTKAKTIFEAAVVTRVKTEVARLEEEFEQRLQEQFEEAAEGLVEKVDGYLGLMAEKWLKDNELALEIGIKSEVMEGFVAGMKTLFSEHYIDVPDDKFDILSSLEEQVAQLTEKLDEVTETNVSMRQTMSEMKKIDIIAEAAEGLTDVEIEKFTSLASELVFESEATYTEKLQVIRENYFSKKTTGKSKTLTESVVTDSPVEEEKEVTQLTEQMQYYTAALSRLAR